MNFLSRLISSLPELLISLPIVMLALSVHESAHGYAAYKLGDHTAYNLGRISLNPMKHFDLMGFLCMLVFHVGWASPVPINARYFKKPRYGMAITAAAGPLSNLASALVFAVLLRLEILIFTLVYGDNAFLTLVAGLSNSDMGMKLLCVLTYFLYCGVLINVSLAIFNLIPIPPFDGSRIAHLLLPPKWYFKIMRHEQKIMIGMLIAFWLLYALRIDWLSAPTSWVSGGILRLLGFGNGSDSLGIMNLMLIFIQNTL